MSLRTIAAGIAVVWMSGPAAAMGNPGAVGAAASTPAFPAGVARPIPYLPALVSADATYRVAGGPDMTDPLPRRSTVLREVVIAGAAIGIGFLLDDSIEPGSGTSTAVDDIGQFIGSPFTLASGSAVMWIGGSAAHNPTTVGTAKRLLASIAATTLTVGVLKKLTDRERPDGSNRYSFPSGHSGASFAAATVLDRRYGPAVGWPAYGVASFVAASRVVGNHHFFSDVVAGAVIGRFFGRIFTQHS